ncbi:MAG TPA: helix-turn-helix domain-containing protein [Acidimicrobiales bacterium]|nr:helix-turn-helix domain-containing protein [Acidimicrobiales bacterium]
MKVAERLLGERGIGAVSLREIAAAAGQRNNSAVAYQFGSRQGLIEAVFEYRMARNDERRRAMLAAMPPQPGTRDLLEAFFLPMAESIGHDDGVSWHARFLRQVVFEPGFDVFAPGRLDVSTGLRAVITGLSHRLAHLPGPIRGRRLLQVWQMVIHSLADHEAQLAHRAAVMPIPLLVADLVDCAEAVLVAPVSADTRRELDRIGRNGD